MSGSRFGARATRQRSHGVSEAVNGDWRGRANCAVLASVKMCKGRRVEGLISAAAVATYFLWAAGPDVSAYFTRDDMMNLHVAWMKPAGQIVFNNLFYCSSVRSLGDLFYRVAFALGGFHPLPFRLLCYALLSINLLVLHGFAKRLTGSSEIALLSTAVGAYHARFRELYCSTGTVFDLLCFPFYFGALTLYIGVRSTGAPLKGRGLALFLALYVCALNAKEMAVTLPLIVAVYELLYHTPRSLRDLATVKWLREPGIPFLACAAITAPYVLHLLVGAQEFKGHPNYTTQITAGRLFGTLSMYFDEIFYRTGWFNAWKVMAVWAAWGGAAWLLRSRHLLFCLLISGVALLPLAFISPRAMYAIYLPWAGWAVCVGLLLSRFYQAIWQGLQRLKPALSAGPGRVWRVAVLMLTLVLLARAHRVQRSWTIPCRVGSQIELRALERRLAGVPKPAPHSQILVINDPFGDNTPYYFLRLFYQDRTLDVVRARPACPPSMVVEYRDGDWVVR